MGTQLKIITSNIRYANAGDGIHNWEKRLPLLANFYLNELPDILGTQEGRQIQLNELDLLLPDLVLVDQHRKWIDERMYPCLFINPQTIKVERSGDIWLSETPNLPGSKSFQSAFPRLCTWAEVTILSSGQKLMIINTHLDHIYQETRIQQAQVLIEEIKKINNRPIILMGDFNESPLTEIRKTLAEKLTVKDPWTEKKMPEETSHHGFNGIKATDGDRIDWILIPQNYECVELRLEKKSTLEGIYLSDHYPLVATVVPK